MRYLMGILVLAGWCAPLAAAEGKAPATGTVTVLNAESPWRAWHVLKSPLVRFDDGDKPILVKRPWLDRETAQPAASWAEANFDDAGWLRTRLPTACRTPYLARQCLRGAFLVNDPRQVAGLRLSLAYHGGAAVYFNGKEVGRGHLLLPAPDKPALAEPYPKEAFVTASGGLATPARAGRETADSGARDRKASDIAVPQELIQRGVNVLAIEVVRAPYHKVVDEKKGAGVEARELEGRGTPYDLPWNTCEILDVRLTAEDGRGLVPSAAPPAGLQVWNGDLLAWDSDTDFAVSWEPLRPVSIVGARGGSFSGKVLAGSSGGLKGLKVAATELRADSGATIPALCIRVRYAVPWDGIGRYGAQPKGKDILLESPPAEVAAGKGSRAVVPIWITVQVPRDAASGTYRGSLTVQAAGAEPRAAEVLLKVQDWTLPQPQDYRTWVELIQSPDTLAVEYGVPLWSERHWGLITRSLDCLNEIGSRTVYVPLICHTNFGNEQSMVRWVKKAGGDSNQYEYDFSIMEKYLDLVEKHMGRPKIVCFNAWDIYLKQPEKEPGKGVYEDQYGARYALKGKGPAVTVLEPSTGKTQTLYLPRFEDKESKALWGPLFKELSERMKKRGLQGAMMIGMFWELWPSKEEVQFFNEIAPGLPWVNLSHLAKAAELYGIGRIGYWMKAFGLEYNPDPSKGRTYGWKRSDLMAEYHRFGYWNGATPPTLRYDAEFNITGNQRGIGRIGGDYWPVTRDGRGQRAGDVVERYPQSKWHNWDIGSWLLAPGPAGPVATARYENVREGVQECDARIFIEAALTDPALKAKLGDELAKRAQETLDGRLPYLWTGVSTLQLSGRLPDYATYTPQRNQVFAEFGGGVAGQAWFLATGWQERSERLYSLTGEVQRKLEVK